MQVYFVPHVETFKDRARSALMLGRLWLAQHQDEGTPFILVPLKGWASDNDVIEELTAKAKVPWCIPKNFPPNNWAGGPVLAPWADDKVIERITQRPERITSLCVLKWLEHDNQAWLEAHQAVDVTDPDRVVPPPTISDGVVLAAMEEITGSINLSTGLIAPYYKGIAHGRLDYLKHWNRELVAEEIIPWALANGWGVEQASQLEEVIEGLNAGRVFRNIRPYRIRDRGVLLKKWEQQARSRETR